MENKEKYLEFCKKTYVPIYSQPWWLDAVCGEENWDVWLYYEGNEVKAASPFYIEKRDSYKYITKAPLTQNNGILILYPEGTKEVRKQAIEERVVDEFCGFMSKYNCDVYEQQYHYSFTNWLPFYWNGYKAIVRYTYVIENTVNIEEVWKNFSSKYRKNIKKGKSNIAQIIELNEKDFYDQHKLVFEKQNLPVPFSRELWHVLYSSAKKRQCGKAIAAINNKGEVLSVLFLIWDEKSMYHLLGGSMPEYQHLETYNALTWEAIKSAADMSLVYDFEGSVIKRIAKSFREFGGIPKPYFRIRKIFNPDIIMREAEEEIEQLRQ